MKRVQYLMGAIAFPLLVVLAIVYPVTVKVCSGILAFAMICGVWTLIKDNSGDYF
jgi:hypothetical protein